MAAGALPLIDGALASLTAHSARVEASGNELALRANLLRRNAIAQTRLLREKLATASDDEKEALGQQYTTLCSERALLDSVLGSTFALSKSTPNASKTEDVSTSNARRGNVKAKH